MRILIVSDAWVPQGNGVVRTYLDLLPHLAAAGHETKVIGPGDFTGCVPLPGYAEIKLCLPEIFRTGRMARKVDAFAPDTIHIATEGPLGWAARRLCLRRGWPFTTCYHTHFADYAHLRAERLAGRGVARLVQARCIGMLQRFHNRAASVLSATESLDLTLRRWGVTAPLHRFTRGVDTGIFHPGEKIFFAGLVRPVALYVGRVAVEKNLPAFLEMAWAGSKIVVGAGPDMEKLKAAYPAVVFTGRKSGAELAAHYRGADVFVFPSRTDTFGIVLIEAMACGLPLAGYPVTGPGDIISEPFLGMADSDLGTAARGAMAAPGTAAERFSYLNRFYTWPLASAQFVAGVEKALISR